MTTPITHLEKSIAGTVDPVTHLEKVIAEYGGGGGGGEVTVDTELLPSSPNPVRNSAIYAALEDKASKDDIADFVTDDDVEAAIADAIGDITKFEYYPCGVGEYDPNSGVPTVANPDTNHIYLTPTSGTNLNMYAYINSAFTFLGTTEVDLSGYAKTENLTDVAFSGDYADLINTPTIPAVVTVDSAITQSSSNPVESSAIHAALAQKANSSTVAAKANTADLANVAFSGDYADLIHTPIPPTLPNNIVLGEINGTDTELTINVIDSGTPAAGTADTVITIVKG